MDMEDNMKIYRNTIATSALACALMTLGVAAPAAAKTDVSPYIELTQVLTADLKNGGDVLTYTSAAAGINATISNSRAELQVDYRYEHRFAWDKNTADDDIHSGLARGRFEVVPNMLNFEAGALATRSRTDIRGSDPTLSVGNLKNVSQVYSAYAGPSFGTQVGPVDVAASYRLGYTKVDTSETVILPTGQDRLNAYDDSVSHLATASVGMELGVLPFGWNVSGAYEREDTGQLDQRYVGKSVRGDVVLPVTSTVALVGGVGYEDIEISEKAPLLDAFGDPVVDAKGRFQSDPASPRLLSYNEDGIYWDAGVAWKPSRRTSFEARVGRRYGSMSYTGTASWQPTDDAAVNLAVFDEVSTFGQQLNDNLSRLPTQFGASQNYGGCVFSGGGGDGAGGCLNPAFQSINGSSYRSRGVVALLSAGRGRFKYGVGGGYVQRKYLTPTIAGLTTLNGVKDENYFAQGFASYELTRQSNIDADVYANYSNSGIAGAPSVLGTGATTTYRHNFGRLSTTASVGLYAFDQEGFDKDLTASALLGMRYQF
jgi:hypothetical protein